MSWQTQGAPQGWVPHFVVAPPAPSTLLPPYYVGGAYPMPPPPPYYVGHGLHAPMHVGAGPEDNSVDWRGILVAGLIGLIVGAAFIGGVGLPTVTRRVL